MSSKTTLIGARRRMPFGQFRRISGIDQVDELHPLHHPPAAHVQAGDDPLGQHASSTKFSQDTHAGDPGFLRMKLYPHHVAALHGARKKGRRIR